MEIWIKIPYQPEVKTTLQEAKEKVSSGYINPSQTFVWYEGITEWTLLSTLFENLYKTNSQPPHLHVNTPNSLPPKIPDANVEYKSNKYSNKSIIYCILAFFGTLSIAAPLLGLPLLFSALIFRIAAKREIKENPSIAGQLWLKITDISIVAVLVIFLLILGSIAIPAVLSAYNKGKERPLEQKIISQESAEKLPKESTVFGHIKKYSLILPEGWKEFKKDSEIDDLVCGNFKVGGFRVKFISGNDMSNNDCIEEMKRFERNGSIIKELSPNQNVIIDGRDWVEYESSHIVKGVEYANLYRVCKTELGTYLITGSTRIEPLNSNINKIKCVLDTFKFPPTTVN
jgi:hypothetical protein